MYIALAGLCSVSVTVGAGRVLLFPYGHGFTSRLVDMRNMGQLLHEGGHRVTFLINEEDRRHLESVPEATFYTYPTPEGRIALIDDEAWKSSLIKAENSSMAATDQILNLIKRHLNLCEELLMKKSMLEKIKADKFELLIVDFAESCGRILTQYLDIPTMAYSSTGLTVDQVLFPNLPSIVPTPFVHASRKMTFLERVKNTLTSVTLDLVIGPYFYSSFENLQKKYGLNQQARVPFDKVFADQIYLSHTDFALEEPRPLLPNVILVGGMHVQEVKPLDPSLREFIDGAGDDGVVLVSFGSLVNQLEASKAELIARVLAKLKQKVIWRFKGRPKGLGANTKLMDWIPQNDLLAHPNMKAFVTHCGIHGTYETLYHGVPVVTVPLMFDQYDNAVRLTERAEMGVNVDITSMTEETLEAAIKQVLEDPKYKQNAVYSSQVLKDHPLTAQERFLFYVNYVIRHKGIGKMKLEPMLYMNSLQLYCIDVYMFLMSVVILLLYMFYSALRFCLRRFCKSSATQEVSSKKTK